MQQIKNRLDRLNQTFNSLGFRTPQELVDFLNANPKTGIKELNRRIDTKLQLLEEQQAGKQKPDRPHREIAPEKKWTREEVLGTTPGVDSPVGRKEEARMRKEGKLIGQGDQRQFFDRRTQKWYSIKDANMGHTHDAVNWWNEKGHFYGAKEQLVRDWQMNPDNYEFEYGPENQLAGARLGETYVAPHPDPITPDELAGKVKPR